MKKNVYIYISESLWHTNKVHWKSTIFSKINLKKKKKENNPFISHLCASRSASHTVKTVFRFMKMNNLPLLST